jgi:hypothetical protein
LFKKRVTVGWEGGRRRKTGNSTDPWNKCINLLLRVPSLTLYSAYHPRQSYIDRMQPLHHWKAKPLIRKPNAHTMK